MPSHVPSVPTCAFPAQVGTEKTQETLEFSRVDDRTETPSMRALRLASISVGRCRHLIRGKAWLTSDSKACCKRTPCPMSLARDYSSGPGIWDERGIPWTPSTLPPRNGNSGKLAMASSGTEPSQVSRTAYIALGSNLGNRIGMIEKACDEMTARGIRVRRTSTLWETEPMYVLDQDSFVNGVCEVETSLEPLALLDELQDIERSMGRKKIVDKGPRNIDLDILLYEDRVVNHERLTLPHAGIAEREFVLRPLAELIPHKPIYASNPWKLTQDYLNALPSTSSPMSTMTPMTTNIAPLHALQRNRKTHVMAIINATPDSFSDGGVHTTESLRTTIASFVEDGATILDVGGQSTAPGTPEVSAEEEMSRVLPVIKLIRDHPQTKDAIISVDTYRAAVAEAAILAGADIVNDVSAGTLDEQMLPTVARLGKTICLMHMRGTPGTMTTLTDYGAAGLVPTLADELQQRVAAAERAGIRRWRLLLDPGIGFAKSAAQNLELLRRFDELRDWPGLRGLPWLLGPSRKSFVGRITGVADPRQRVWGTAAAVAAAVQGGADIVRVHDVRPMVQVVKMADAIWRV